MYQVLKEISRAPFKEHVSQVDGRLFHWMCRLQVILELVTNNKIVIILASGGKWLPINGRDVMIDLLSLPFHQHWVNLFGGRGFDSRDWHFSHLSDRTWQFRAPFRMRVQSLTTSPWGRPSTKRSWPPGRRGRCSSCSSSACPWQSGNTSIRICLCT